jgi:nucleotide-binding universal stress UspA family protein
MPRGGESAYEFFRHWHGGSPMFTHVLIPTDGSELAGKAVEGGVALAAALGARVTFLIAVEPFHVLTATVAQIEETRAGYEASSVQHAGEVLAACEAVAGAAGVASTLVKETADEPHRAILRTAAAAGCDLIAMSSRGRRGLAAAVLGSQTMRVLADSTIPVIVYR